MKSLEINFQSYQKVLDLVKHLPKAEIEKLIADLQKDFSFKKKKNKPGNDLQKLILSAPTWTNAEYKIYQEGRKNLNLLRSK